MTMGTHFNAVGALAFAGHLLVVVLLTYRVRRDYNALDILIIACVVHVVMFIVIFEKR